MKKTSNNAIWLVINFSVYLVGALISSSCACSNNSICLFDNGFNLVDTPLFLLTVLIIWLFTWGILCKLCQLEHKVGESLAGKKQLASYVMSLVTSYVYPFVMVGG